MAITDIPLFGMLKTRMAWHQERQRLLSENVANSNTPSFRPSDLAPPKFDSRSGAGSVELSRTSPGHILASASSGSGFGAARHGGHDVRPSGNAVNLEDEMMKVASNQMDYQAVTSLYQRSLMMLKSAVGKR